MFPSPERLRLYNLDPDPHASLSGIAAEELEPKQQPLGDRDQGRLVPLENTFRHIVSIGARTAVVQRNVQDPDFIAEHGTYYAKWPLKVPRYCTRVHLFSETPPSDDVLSTIAAFADSDKQDVYLGFMTFRPVASSPVGATILATAQPEQFITARDYFKVNLAGHVFVVKGTPFLQQDNAVGACAQASIWMALRTLRRKEGQAAFDPAQITNAATRFLVYQRTLPNRSGLSIDQIAEAVRSAGFSPHYIALRPQEEDVTELEPSTCQEQALRTRSQLYPYIESGLPVVLALRRNLSAAGHAILLVGHGWNRTPRNESRLGTLRLNNGGNIHLVDASTWTDPLIIHNDNTGPYQALTDDISEGYCIQDAIAAIPFLPEHVFIDGEEARGASIRLLIRALNPLSGDLTMLLDEQRTAQFVIRTYLMDRSEFRYAAAHGKMCDFLQRYYQHKWLPRRIWITEINAAPLYAQSPDGNTECLGEILLDPSAEPADCPFLTIHLRPALLGTNDHDAGALIDRDAFSGEIETKLVPNDTAYGIRLTSKEIPGCIL